MDITRMSDAELVQEIAGRCVTDVAAVDLAKFIRQCVQDSQKELMGTVTKHFKNIASICSQTNQPEKFLLNLIYRECLKLEQALASVEGKGSK